MCLIDSRGRRLSATLKEALYVPSYPQDIFSVKATTSSGAMVIFKEGEDALSFTDDYSSAVFVYCLKHKSDTVEATERFLANTAPYGKVRCMRSDNGTEFTGQGYQLLSTIYFTGTESDMKQQHHTPHTRMVLLSATGEPFLTWLDVCF